MRHILVQIFAVGEGLALEAGKATGMKFAASYPDVSGVFWINPKREVILISSVALTLNGAVEGAEFKEASDRFLAACIAAAMTGPLGTMKPVKAAMDGTAEEKLAHLGRELLGYGDDATVEDIAKGLAGLLKAKREAEEEDEDDEDEIKISDKDKPETELTPQMSKELEAKVDALAKSVETIMESIRPIAASVQELKQRDDTATHNAAVEAIITASVKEGKVVPASVKKLDDKGRYVMDAAAAKEIMECITASVPTDGKKTVNPTATEEVTAADEEARIACGISPEDWKKGHSSIRRAFEPKAAPALVS